MNFSLKPHQLIAHWVPGFIVLGLLLLADWQNEQKLTELSRDLGPVLGSLVAAVLAFVFGELLDCIRDLSEHLMDRFYKKINWKFIWLFPKEDLERMEEWYWTYYVFAFNLTLALLLALLPQLAPTCLLPHKYPETVLLTIGVATPLFALSAYFLRGEIAKEVSERLKELEPAKFTPSKRKAVKRKTP